MLTLVLLTALAAPTPAPASPPVPAPAPALPYGQDMRVPNTKVSVRLEKDAQGGNISSIFIDEQYDTLSKTFVQFRCAEGGKLNFFLKTKVPLLSQADLVAGRPPSITYRVDGQQPRSFPGVLTRKGGEFDRFVLATNDASDARFLGAFKAARKKVELQVTRTGGASPIRLTFPVKGVAEALSVVEGCGALP